MLNRISVSNRNVAFLLEGGMISSKEQRLRYHKKCPWAKTLARISTRCNGKTQYYHKKGIKNFLNTADLKYLWFRDKAYLMERPSIDRKNSDKHYTLENCRYLELIENIRGNANRKATPIKQFSLDGKLIKVWRSITSASKALKIPKGSIVVVCQGTGKTAHGYKWKYLTPQPKSKEE